MKLGLIANKKRKISDRLKHTSISENIRTRSNENNIVVLIWPSINPFPRRIKAPVMKSLTFESVNEILNSQQPKESLLALLSPSTLCFSEFLE